MFWCIALYIIHCVHGSNVLFINTVPSPSHHIFNSALAYALAEKGHNVTMITPDRSKEAPNMHIILFEGMYEDSSHEEINFQDVADINSFESIKTMYDWCAAISEYGFTTQGFKTIMNYPDDFKFDVVIMDITIGQAFYPIINKFNNPPVVGITAFLLPPYLSSAMGNHLYPAFYPHYNLKYTNKMNFLQRLNNFLVTYWEIYYRNTVYMPTEQKIAMKALGNIKPLTEVERNISLLLSNTDPVLDYPVPLPPNIIPVGGMHIKPAKPLPKDLEDIMNQAKHGVILFSMGSNVKWQVTKAEITEQYVKAFSKLPQIIIWKSEIPLKNAPKNVVVKSWLPQNDILGHPKLKLFISHGGGLSTQEAIYHGVPVVGIPLFADQVNNIYKFVKKGLGLSLTFTTVTSQEIYETILEVINNTKYKTNMMKISAKYKDQMQTPLERAIFWTEYVIRHKSIDDLGLPARDMTLIQSSNLDVLGAILFIIICAVLVILKVVKLVLGLFAAEKPKVKTK